MQSLKVVTAQSQKGGVLLEFSVIVPILLLICFGLFDIGQAFSQKAWLESVAYQSVMMGGELQEQRRESMNAVTNELVDVLHAKLDKKFVDPTFASTASENTALEDEGERTVTAVVPGEVRMISNIVRIPYHVSLTGPMLVRSGTLEEELYPKAINDKTDKDVGVYYDCLGLPIIDVITGGCDLVKEGGVCNCYCAGDGVGENNKGCH